MDGPVQAATVDVEVPVVLTHCHRLTEIRVALSAFCQPKYQCLDHSHISIPSTSGNTHSPLGQNRASQVLTINPGRRAGFSSWTVSKSISSAKQRWSWSFVCSAGEQVLIILRLDGGAGSW